MALGKIESVAVVRKGKIAVAFDDAQRATIELTPIIRKRGNLAALGDSEIFKDVRVSDDGWSIEWPGANIDFGVSQLRRWADEQAGRTMSADRFREWMQRNHLTLDSAADALGLSRRTVAYYLSGEQPVPKTVMLATEAVEARKVA